MKNNWQVFYTFIVKLDHVLVTNPKLTNFFVGSLETEGCVIIESCLIILRAAGYFTNLTTVKPLYSVHTL